MCVAFFHYVLCSKQLLPRPKVVLNSWSSWVYRSSRYMKYRLFIHYSFSSCCCFLHFQFYLPLSLLCAPGSRGCWGPVRPACERGDRVCGGIRGHGYTAVWRQYSHSPAKCQEEQVGTVQFVCLLNNVLGFLYGRHVWNGFIHRNKQHPQIFVLYFVIFLWLVQ